MKSKQKILKLNNGKVSWFIFNVYGLKLNKSKSWQNFLFGDSTIVNKSDLKNYLQDELHYTKNNLLFYLNENPDSFLIVHIGGEITKENEKEIIKQAKQRANEIISIVYFCFLYLSNNAFGISLDFELNQSSGGTFTYLTSSRTVSHSQQHTKGEFWIQCPNPPYQLSRDSLLKILYKDYFKEFVNAIVKKEGIFFKILSNSLTNFYRATNTPSAISQFLGAVTSTEILLKERNDKYDSIKDRVYVLLGEKFYNDFIEDTTDRIGIFKLRNDIVHDGQFCFDYDAGRAIRLFNEIIISYSNISNKFSSKDEICKYLDIIYKHLTNPQRQYKKDPFKLMLSWGKIKYPVSNIDWVALFLISYFSINQTVPKNLADTRINLISAVYCYSQLRNISLDVAFKHIQNLVIYNKIRYRNFKDFSNCFLSDKQKHEDSYNLLIKYTKFDL